METPCAFDLDFTAALFSSTPCACPKCKAFVAEAAAKDAAAAAAVERVEIRKACRRCGGAGRLAAYWYNQGGRCFACAVGGV